MTAPDYVAMSDAALNEQAARMMGLKMWRPRSGGSPLVTHVIRPTSSIPHVFDPAADLNHSAELGAAFLAAWPDVRMGIIFYSGQWDVAVSVPYPDPDAEDVNLLARTIGPLEARARTVAVLQAWHALKGDG